MILKRAVDEAQHAAPLVEAVLVGPLRIETARMAEIARDDQHVALWQLGIEALGFKVDVGEVVASHRGGSRRIGSQSVPQIASLVG